MEKKAHEKPVTVPRKEGPEEKAEAKPKKVNLIEHLEAVVEGLEKHKAAFSQDEQTAMQGFVKRLSRTMGTYRAPE